MSLTFTSRLRLGLAMPPLWLLRRRQVRRLAARCAETRTLVLSYDDGPGREMTPAVLDVLVSHGATATFFLLGDRANEHPEVADRLCAEGHETGCHGRRHVSAWNVAPETAVGDVDEGYAALARWVAPDAPFRPPYGRLTFQTLAALRRRGASPGWWTVDSGDTWDALPPAGRALAAVRRAGGGVVLMHDFDRGRIERAAFVLRLTESLLRAARVEGWSVRPLCRVLGPEPETRVAGGGDDAPRPVAEFPS